MIFLKIDKIENLICNEILNGYYGTNMEGGFYKKISDRNRIVILILTLIFLPLILVYFSFLFSRKSYRIQFFTCLQELAFRRLDKRGFVLSYLLAIKDIGFSLDYLTVAIVCFFNERNIIILTDPKYTSRLLLGIDHIRENLFFIQDYRVYSALLKGPYNFHPKLLKIICDNINENEVNKYYENKFFGFGNYEDSNRGISIDNKIKFMKHQHTTHFLHVFGDSPYPIFKKDSDLSYLRWLQLLLSEEKSHSNKFIHFRIHPSSSVWGENPFIWVAKIFNHLPPNYFISYKMNSSKFDINSSDCIASYSGNVINESISVGKCVKCGVVPSIVENFPDFFEIKQESGVYIIDNITDRQKYIARLQIYLQEKIFSFKDILDFEFTYKNRPINDEKLSSLQNQVNINLENIRQLGRQLKNGSMTTYVIS